MVGAFACATQLISIDSIAAAITETIPGAAAASNITAAREAFDSTKLSLTLLQEALMKTEELFT